MGQMCHHVVDTRLIGTDGQARSQSGRGASHPVDDRHRDLLREHWRQSGHHQVRGHCPLSAFVTSFFAHHIIDPVEGEIPILVITERRQHSARRRKKSGFCALSAAVETTVIAVDPVDIDHRATHQDRDVNRCANLIAQRNKVGRKCAKYGQARKVALRQSGEFGTQSVARRAFLLLDQLGEHERTQEAMHRGKG